MIETILVALDGSRRAPGVFAAAAEVAKRFDAELTLLRVVYLPTEFPPAGHVAAADPLRVHLIREAESALAAFSMAAFDVRIAPAVTRDGQPWRVILEVANELNVDLIVMGSHGYYAFDRILGTTAGKVVNLARRNVMVVHEHYVAPSTGASAEQLSG